MCVRARVCVYVCSQVTGACVYLCVCIYMCVHMRAGYLQAEFIPLPLLTHFLPPVPGLYPTPWLVVGAGLPVWFVGVHTGAPKGELKRELTTRATRLLLGIPRQPCFGEGLQRRCTLAVVRFLSGFPRQVFFFSFQKSIYRRALQDPR